MASNDHLIGTTLGTCTLEKRIGQGGMSIVYLARQAHPARYVAVKVLQLPPGRSGEDHNTFLARFRREADIVAKLEHVNIIPIFEYGEHGEIAYLVMPYVSGGSLGQLLARAGKFPLHQAMNYIQQAAAALDYAHARNVIHRDLKPSNFLIYPDGRLVLADFGIARLLSGQPAGSTLTAHGAFLGTPAYMSPEMVRGEPIDHRADIYALGIVLFEMLNGGIPFRGDNAYVIMNKHLREPLPSLHAIDPTLLPTVDAVLQKATAKRREDRYMSAGALAQDVRVAINAAGIPIISSLPLPVSPPLNPEQTLRSTGSSVSRYEPNAVTSSYNRPASVTSSLPQNRQRFWSPLLKTLPLMALLIAGLLIGLQIAGVFAGSPKPPTVINTPMPTILTLAPLPTPTPTPTSIPAPTPTSIPTLTPTEQAQMVVQQYYTDINNQDYQAAYALLTPKFQQGLSYDTFSNGYTQDLRSDVTFDSITENPDGSVTVITTLHVLKTNSQTQTYLWTATVLQQPDGSWKIDHATNHQI